MDAVTDTVESKLLDTKKRELPSQDIAAIVLLTLKHFNIAAFMRFLAYQTNPASPAELDKVLRKYR